MNGELLVNERKRNLWRYILPTVAGSCCTFLYVIVDGIFVGRGVGVDALGAVNIAMPFTMIMIAFATLMTIGGITITAIRLGRGDKEGANDAFMHAATISVVVGVIIMLLGMIFSKQIAVMSGANETFLEMTNNYIFYCSAFSLPFICSIILQGFVRNDGSPVLASVAVITGATMNIFLDWLFIFPLQMGVGGTAIASGLGQFASLPVLLWHFIRQHGTLSIKKFSVSFFLLGKILRRGLPEMIAQFGMPVLTLCMNYSLIRLIGDMAVSAFAILAYLTSFSMGVFFGVSEGLQPLIGQSYGRRDEEELKYYFRAGVIVNWLGSTVLYVLLILFRKYICVLFNSNAVLLQITTEALPKFSWAFVVIALNLMISTYLYSTKRTTEAVIVAVCRCLVFDTLIILLLPLAFGSGIIWYTVGIAEFLSLIIAFALLKHSEKDGVIFR